MSSLIRYLHIKEHFDTLENLNIVWFGDLNNVLYSFAECLNFLPTVNLDIFKTIKNIQI